jgi:zona occludens toxin (predicted ATPase)
VETAHKVMIASVAAAAALWHDPAPVILLGLVILTIMLSCYLSVRYTIREVGKDVDKKLDAHIAKFHAESRDFRDAVHRDASDAGG